MATEKPKNNLDGARRIARMVDAYADTLRYRSGDHRDLVADFNSALVEALFKNDDLLLMLLDPAAAYEETEARRLANEDYRQKLAARQQAPETGG